MGKRGPKPRQGTPTTIRLEPDLRTKLDEAAARSGRNPASEVRARLRASFNAIEYGNPETKRLASALAFALEIEAEQTGFTWFENAWAWARAKAAIDAVLSLLKPPGDPGSVPDDAAVLRHLRAIGVDAIVPKAAEQLKDTSLGELSGKAAIALIEQVADGTAAPSLDHLREMAAGMKDMLQAFDNDTVALSDLKSAANFPRKVGSGKILRRLPNARQKPGQDEESRNDD